MDRVANIEVRQRCKQAREQCRDGDVKRPLKVGHPAMDTALVDIVCANAKYSNG